jgi:hypothetical protein
MGVLVEVRPMRRFCSITSRRLLGVVRGSGRSRSIFDTIDPAFVGRFRNQIETELLADDASKKASHRVLLPFRRSHNAAIVAPAGARSIATIRACLVSGRPVAFDAGAADRVRDLFFLAFGAADRVNTLVFD